tara:strand:- start:546 stop:2054 length:1509 start_codon:yes stop_codon:yes gene_type:complete
MKLIKFRLKRYIARGINIFLNKFFRSQIVCELIDSIKDLEKSKKTELKRLNNYGSIVAGYIPYIKDHTEVIIYNFFSTNYGVRSDFDLIIGLANKDLTQFSAIYRRLHFRQSLILNPQSLKEFENINFEPDSCIALMFNQKIQKNHAGHGGHLRFWGIWSQFAAFSHSMPLPSNIEILKYKLQKSNDYLLERLCYPIDANFAYHYGLYKKPIKVEDRGDLSGILKTSSGYSLLANKDGDITTCFHDAPYIRTYCSNNYTNLTPQIVAIPPFEDLDVEMFFGESCSSYSSYMVNLYSINDKNSSKDLSISQKVSLGKNNIVNIKSIFDKELFNKRGAWVEFIPESGSHSGRYINLVYRHSNSNLLYDGVHSHSFSKGLIKGRKKRSLKFAPFLVYKKNNNFHKDHLNSILAVWGNINSYVKLRIRLYQIRNSDWEAIEFFNIPPKEVFYINLSKIVLESIDLSDKEYFICQIESEEDNLNATMFSPLIDENNYRIAVDHLTGG